MYSLTLIAVFTSSYLLKWSQCVSMVDIALPLFLVLVFLEQLAQLPLDYTANAF
jgi:hypothetical protein